MLNELVICRAFLNRAISRAESASSWSEDNLKFSILMSAMWEELDEMERKSVPPPPDAAAAPVNPETQS